MILDTGSNVLVAHRRMFPDDATRLFYGVVDAYEAGIVRVTGYTLLFDHATGKCMRKRGERTKIISITSGNHIVYQLPSDADVSAVEVKVDETGRVLLTDGRDLALDITERYQVESPATFD